MKNENGGFLNNLKQKWNDYLKRLGKTNKELFGDGHLRCCNLNKNEPYRHRHQ